jgi:hypothetical protein
MAAVLSSGFCAFVASFASTGGDGCTGPMSAGHVWQRPVLQLVDIQAFPCHRPAVASVLYAALSDGASLVWCLAPPGSTLEGHMRSLALEVGCCLALEDYAIVQAENGRNVAVALAATVSQTPVSLIGQPVYDPVLYQLSPQAAVHQQRGSARHQDEVQAPPVDISAIVAMGASVGFARYTIVGRVLWKSKLRRLMNADGGGGAGRYVFDIKLTDRHGDAVKVVFWGSKKSFDTVSVADCIKLADCTAQWGDDVGEGSELVALQAGDKSALDILAEDPLLPYAAAKCIGACAAPFLDVRRVCEEAAPGDVVCCQGIVSAAGPVLATSTKRGQVDRVQVTIRDRSSPHAVELTLWDQHARETPFQLGKLYFFRDVAVRMFGAKKVLSTRGSSEVFEPPPALVMADGAAVPEISLTYATVSQASVPFTVDLNQCSETVPLVASIQAIKLPIFYTACSDCGRQANANELCPNCGSGDHELRFLVRMVLSDGLQCLHATGFTFVGEALFGETTAAFLEHLAARPRYDEAAVDALSGLPVLVKLVRNLDGDAHIVELAHLDLAVCAQELAQLIATYDI